MTHSSDETIGFIGLGLMGRPMAIHLHQCGYPLVICNRSQPVVVELCALGMTAAASPRDAARQSTIIIVMVSDTAATEAVLLGGEGVCRDYGPGRWLSTWGQRR